MAQPAQCVMRARSSAQVWARLSVRNPEIVANHFATCEELGPFSL
jgi:hypothetical protein